MKKISVITIMIVVTGIVSILIFPQEEEIILTPNVFAQDYLIPAWIKNNAGWWATNQIDDSSFLQGIQYLIKEEIMIIPSTETSDSSGSQKVPTWVKNNAGWWAEGQIDDSSFVAGIQWLVSNGIIVVEEKLIHTHADLRVAFIGDQGFGPNAVAVLNLIKDEEVQMVLHQGDFDYNDEPDKWDKQISDVLGSDFPYFASIGHHDEKVWNDYQEKLYDRLKKIPDAVCYGDLGVKSNCTYKGLFFILVAPGGYTNDSKYDSFIEKQLNDNDYTWMICSWHNDAYAMQQEVKPNKTGWEVYESCKNGGAIIANAHQHVYAKSKTLIDFENQIVDPDWPGSNKLRVKEGATFTFISGLGGKSILSMTGSHEALTKMYPDSVWPVNYSSDQGASYGALFCTFNVGGQPNKAYCYFKNIDGRIIDEFTITSFLGSYIDKIDSTDVDLSGRDLTGNDLSNTTIIDTNLSNATLVGADLSNAVLIGTTLTGADLTDANLTGVSLKDKDLTGTILTGTDLTDVSLTGVDLSGKNLTGAILRGADLTDANLTGVDLSGRDLTGAILRGMDLSDKDLTGTILRDADLTDANLDLSGVDLTGAILRGMDLSDKDLTGTILTGTDLTDVSLTGVDLSGKNLYRTILTGTDLTDAVLPWYYLSGKNFQGTIFDGVNLSERDLSESEFEFASFKNTNMKNADLSYTRFVDVDLTKVKSLVGANLFSTVISYSNLSGNDLDGVTLGYNNFQRSNLSGLDFTVISNKSIHAGQFDRADLSNANLEGVEFVARDDEGKIISRLAEITNGAKFYDESAHNLSSIFWNEGGYDVWVVGKEVVGNDLKLNIINRSNFGTANLQNVNLSNADLTYSVFTNADLTNANLSNASLPRTNFGSANLQNVNLSNADLREAALTNADLTNANLSNATLTGADLTGANLTGAVLDGAILNCKNHAVCTPDT